MQNAAERGGSSEGGEEGGGKQREGESPAAAPSPLRPPPPPPTARCPNAPCWGRAGFDGKGHPGGVRGGGEQPRIPPHRHPHPSGGGVVGVRGGCARSASRPRIEPPSPPAQIPVKRRKIPPAPVPRCGVIPRKAVLGRRWGGLKWSPPPQALCALRGGEKLRKNNNNEKKYI